MIDYHVHIGQFEEVYYDPLEILQIVADSGVSGCAYSSTTSGKEGITYGEIRKEVELAVSKFSSDTFKPYLWYIPSYRNEGITIEKAMDDLPYKGIKIHPRANNWNRSIPESDSILHELFGFAGEHTIPILIHTGPNGVDAPATFEDFFAAYPNAKVILAHCRPIREAIKMLKKYDNVYGDTSFVPKEWMAQLIRSRVGNKIYTGSDFPITHYMETHYYFERKNNQNFSLHDQYLIDSKEMETWEAMFYV
ncbi:MAG: amidohydrolase family protein [Treponema sp.]|nr:amidohydrolase family protein [Treponema sp.]